MQETGKLIRKMDAKTGISEVSGKAWVNQEFVIETMGSYPKKVAFQVSGEERVQALQNVSIGAGVRVTFYAESTESKDKTTYFTKLRCTQIDVFTSTFPKIN